MAGWLDVLVTVLFGLGVFFGLLVLVFVVVVSFNPTVVVVRSLDGNWSFVHNESVARQVSCLVLSDGGFENGTSYCG